MLELLLKQGYNDLRMRFLLLGIKHGFLLHCAPFKTSLIAKNHKSALINSSIVDSKIRKELELNRIAGPYPTPPFPNFHVSPIGLVPKKEPNKFRLIHDLSFPKDGDSVNSCIPRHYTAVSYQSLDTVINIVTSLGAGCLIAKADVQSAFRILPSHPRDYPLLGFKWRDMFYYDKRTAMGASTSCLNFESLSKALSWILTVIFCVRYVCHLLDDFCFFSRANTDECKISLDIFLMLCNNLNIPINEDKTVLPSTTVTVFGVEIDTLLMQARLPSDKLEKAKSLLQSMQERQSIRLFELQSLLGYLQFCCKVIKPGRAFLRRLISLTKGVTKSHHHIRLSGESRKDLKMWLSFIQHFNGITMMSPDIWFNSETIRLFSDAAKTKGYSIILENAWCANAWADSEDYHITVLELYPIVLAVLMWGNKLRDKNILFFCDNLAVVNILNKQTSKDPVIMTLVRKFVLKCLYHNINFHLKHIAGRKNVVSDALSRLQIQKARHLQPSLDPEPHLVPKAWSLSALLC